MARNEAAWLPVKRQRLQVMEAPYTPAGEGEILIENHAVAINPVDWMLPYFGSVVFPWIRRPAIPGSDLAGEVVEVGLGVAGIQVGDRVLAMAAGTSKQRNRAAEGAFQGYTVTLPHLTTVIPDNLSYIEAAVVPLGLATAACGLFQKDLLALDMPAPQTQERHRWVIVTGGATSVGSNAIQLAAAAGYNVITTASPKNFEYVRTLGATHVFDYKSKNLVHQMAEVLQGREVVGALSVAAGSAAECIDVLSLCRGRKFVANCSSPLALDAMARGDRVTFATLARALPSMARSAVITWWKSHHQEAVVKFYDASSVSTTRSADQSSSSISEKRSLRAAFARRLHRV